MPISSKKRFSILKRDNFTCQYCGRRPPEVVLQVDHRHSKKDGGGNNDGNLVTACVGCNQGKGGGTVTVSYSPSPGMIRARGLEGLFFHRWSEPPHWLKGCNQGFIDTYLPDHDAYLVHYFDFMMGDYSATRTIAASEIIGNVCWEFYLTDEDMRMRHAAKTGQKCLEIS